ncbi:MAG: dephospho-CoA kinase [Deltaproteobacteria bacterium]|nr:dephospho-CoA kinase [Deltaproteobacteria bacterium]
MKRLGLTGGIATGKSTAAEMFAEAGWPAISADAIAHGLMVPGSPVADAVFRAFGMALRAADGGVDRRRLGAIVFADADKRKMLETIVHPSVRAAIADAVRSHAAAGAAVCVFDIPLYFESGYDWQCDWAVVVTCAPAQQVARCRAKFGISEAEAAARIQTQWPMAEKIRRADFVIDSSGSYAKTRAQVARIVASLQPLMHAAGQGE